MKIETIITSQTPYFAIVLLITVMILILNRKRTKKPLLLAMMLCAIVLSWIMGRFFQQFWVQLLNLSFLFIWVLVVFLFTEKGILGLKDEVKKDIERKWKDKHPRLFKFHQKHPMLQYAMGYGTACGFLTYATSLTIMHKYKEAWMSLGIVYLIKNERMAHAMIVSQGLNSPLQSLLLVIAIWSAVSFVAAFICSLFVRDKNVLRKGLIPLLVFYSLMIPAPLNMFQRLLLAAVCVASAYMGSKLCFWNVSERLYRLFDEEQVESVQTEDATTREN